MEQANKENGKRQMMTKILIGLIIVGAIGGIVYLKIISGRVYIEKAEINAPAIVLSPKTSGVLEEIYVKQGDKVVENEPVARIDSEIIKAQSDGLVLKTNDDIGRNFAKGEAIVTMIKISDLRVVGHLDEDKGLKDVKVGQQVMFQVDAYGTKNFYGIVDEISETSRDSDIVFSISDKREMKQFDVKIRFNPAEYPELKNGMSAKAWVYKQ
jgi:multidrug resistance efflux pump